MLPPRRAAATAHASPKSTHPVFRLAGIALAEHALGHAKESQHALDDLVREHGHNGAYQIAQVYAFRGERDAAVDWLNRARAHRDGGLILLKVDPLLVKLRGDSRYSALLSQINLRPN
jgi:hypothetical protein